MPLISQEETEKKKESSNYGSEEMTQENLFRHQNLSTVYCGHSTVSKVEILNKSLNSQQIWLIQSMIFTVWRFLVAKTDVIILSRRNISVWPIIDVLSNLT